MNIIYNKKVYYDCDLISSNPFMVTEKGSGILKFNKMLVIELEEKEYKKISIGDNFLFYIIFNDNKIFSHNSTIKNIVSKPYKYLDILTYDIKKLDKNDIRNLKLDLIL